MTTSFILLTKPRWVGFKLTQEGMTDERDFASIPEALAYVRRLPGSAGTPFIVLDEEGKEMVHLTV